MSVLAMPEAPTTVDYDQLPERLQHLFDHFIGKADAAPTNFEYSDAMTDAALVAGIQPPDDGEITKCGCPACYCAVIFPANDPDALVTENHDGKSNLGRIQCPDCSDRHPRPVEQ